MDILIKDAILPSTNCYGCRLFKEEHYEDIYEDRVYQVIGECLAGEFQIEKPYYPNDGVCPLVALPEHGTLKDTDFMLSCLEEIKKDYPEAYKLVSGIIERTPVIVEASNDKT